ncbi:GNAT family N-acetyltransferase [Streptacidiphilus albus]|uniref:GNAT family N-acetyltransferase n=1 Tax=Streptacidiphilus albus TaxID=105425 RepID=UPI00054B1D70|nr:GNAT family protein [Streptacidiphilus albus]
MTARTPAPTTLTGRHVRLEPLALDHVPELFAAGAADEEIWRWMPVAAPRTEDELRAVAAMLLARAPEQLAFAVVARDSGRALGWTTYHEIDARDERLEIGWTWYARSAWRTAVNTESKLLLLTHAFEELGMGRVQWRTDIFNLRSQNAIARLGARRESVHRRERQRPDGSWRDSVYFSLLLDEWPAARARLTERLERG